MEKRCGERFVNWPGAEENAKYLRDQPLEGPRLYRFNEDAN